MKAPAGKTFEPAPEGTHIGTLIKLIDLGVQDGGQYGARRQVYVEFELPEETMKDGKPFAIGRRYTLSMHEKSKMRELVEGMVGKRLTDQQAEDFELTTLLAKPAMAVVRHVTTAKGKQAADLASVAPLPKGMKAPKVVNEPLAFDLDDEDPEVYAKLPDWLKKVISQRVLPDEEASPESDEAEEDLQA